MSIRLRRVDRLRRHRLAAVLAGNQSLEGAVVVLGGDQFLEKEGRGRNRNGETQVVIEGDIASHGKIMITGDLRTLTVMVVRRVISWRQKCGWGW